MDGTPLANRTFDELVVGETTSLVRVADRDDIDLFAALSGDMNPAHMDPAFAATDMFGQVILHGMWTGALVSAVLGTALPGPGTIYLGQDLRFRRPVSPGDTITASVTVREKRAEKNVVLLDCLCVNQHGDAVVTGTAEVIAPTRKIVVARMQPNKVSIRRYDRYEAFLKEARTFPPLATAIVHPCSPETILAAVEARDGGFIDPVLVGPEHKIRAAADLAGVSIEGLRIETTEHSHAAAVRAVELAAGGAVGAIMKGSLHTDELLGAVIARGSGLRTDRWVSHVFAMDVPAYGKPLFVTDAAINIAPTLEQKRDICQNAIDLLLTLEIEEPKVAALAAVETVNTKMPSTLDAAALTVMSARDQIRGGRVDGPLAFDNAVSFDAARIKEITSPVAGQADILLVPDIEAGNMLAKQLMLFANADAAGIVLGARVPIMLTSRSDSLRVRLASAALAQLVAGRRKRAQAG